MKQKSNNEKKKALIRVQRFTKTTLQRSTSIVCLPEQDHPLKWKTGCPLPCRKCMFENTALLQIAETAK